MITLFVIFMVTLGNGSAIMWDGTPVKLAERPPWQTVSAQTYNEAESECRDLLKKDYENFDATKFKTSELITGCVEKKT